MLIWWCNITKKNHENALLFVTIIRSQTKFLQYFTAKHFPQRSLPQIVLSIKGNGLVSD